MKILSELVNELSKEEIQEAAQSIVKSWSTGDYGSKALRLLTDKIISEGYPLNAAFSLAVESIKDYALKEFIKTKP